MSQTALFLYDQVLAPEGQSLADFNTQLVKSKEFSSGFWISIATLNDIRVESTGKTHVTTHHPLIQSFLRQQAKSMQYEKQTTCVSIHAPQTREAV